MEGPVQAQERTHIVVDPSAARPVGPSLHRVDLCAQALGFPLPPAPVFIRPRQKRDHWSITLRVMPGRAEPVIAWLAQWGPRQVVKGPGVAPRVVTATFEEVPGDWAIVMGGARVDHLVITPEGSMSLVLGDDKGQVDAFVEQLKRSLGDQQPPRVRPFFSNGPHDEVRPTYRQTEVISLAVALGYYEVPRRVDLRTLAKRLGLSLGATSELIRRGESLIVSSFIDSLTAQLSVDEKE